MADVYSAIILDNNYWDGTSSWAGETSEANRDTKYSTRRFTSCSAWEADRDGNSQAGDDEHGIISGPWTTADTARCTVLGFNADSASIDCPLTLPDGDNLAAHDGIYGNKANAYLNSYSGGINFYMYEPGTLEGIQALNDTAFRFAIHCRGTSVTRYVKRCLIYSTVADTDGIGDVSASGNTTIIENCAICAERYGLDMSNGTTTCKLINSAVTTAGTGNTGIKGAASMKVRNVVVFNNGGNDYDTLIADVDYGASDETITGTGMIDWDAGATDWAANFTDYANCNFTPLDVDLPNAGIGSGSDADIPTTDVLGVARSSTTPTIGLFEFVSAGGVTMPIFMSNYLRSMNV